MKFILGAIRKADEEFGMISDGDHVLVGVSGGKDSMVLLHMMGLYRYFFPGTFRLSAATLDLGLGGLDADAIARCCRERNIPYVFRQTNIGKVVFETRQESNPCSLCAKMRRGALHTLARELGCSKVALGHHREDVLETFLLSLLYEGRLNTFSPVVRMDRAGITQIRPMVFVPERRLIGAVRRLGLPVQESPCPVAGHTRRADMKKLLTYLHTLRPDAEEYMLRAIRKTHTYHLWDQAKEGRAPRSDEETPDPY
ncbi:MAG: tRNA 2-thiocytidine biosynthesis protein TtcA [Clostridiales bacterium]|nr:tRNA 2-thiocytidine biosynthesis protein TtcA [Clostridiales bacterium]